jgi:hypothetical protein
MALLMANFESFCTEQRRQVAAEAKARQARQAAAAAAAGGGAGSGIAGPAVVVRSLGMPMSPPQ